METRKGKRRENNAKERERKREGWGHQAGIMAEAREPTKGEKRNKQLTP